MAFFTQKKKTEKTSPEALLASGFSGAGQESSKITTMYQVRPMKTEDTIPGTNALLAFAHSNVPIFAFSSSIIKNDVGLTLLAKTLLLNEKELSWFEMSLDSSHLETFQWQLMELTPFCLFSKPGKVDACIWLTLKLWETLKKRSELPGGKSAEIIDTEYISGVFAAERPLELPVLGVYSAPAFKVGTRQYTSHIQNFGIYTNGQEVPVPFDSAVWFKGSFEYSDDKIASKIISFMYAFSKASLPAKLTDAEALHVLTNLALSRFSESVKKFVSLSQIQPGRLGIKAMEAPPNFTSMGEILGASFIIRDNSVSIPSVMIAPAGTLLILGAGLHVPFFQEKLAKKASNFLMELNTQLLVQTLPSIINSPELRPRVPFFCLNELFRLLSDQDLSLVIQNILQSEYGEKRLPLLLFYTVTKDGSDGNPTEFVVPYGPFDGYRISSFMTAAFKENFFQNTRSLQGWGVEECSKGNAEALHIILQAVLSGRIGSSPRLTYLMRSIVLKAEQSEIEKKLSDLKTRGIPFGFLKEIESRVAQRMCAVLDDKDIALALLDCESELIPMQKIISSTRIARLREDILFHKKQLGAGNLNLSESLAAKEKIMAVIESYKKKEQEEGGSL